MGKKIKTKIRTGLKVEYGILDDKGNPVGDFIPECAECHCTRFEFKDNYTVGVCADCRKVVARRTDVYPESDAEIIGRKVIGFVVDALGDFKWVCSACDNDLSFLMQGLATTTCTECGKVTSRNKATLATVGEKTSVRWAL